MELKDLKYLIRPILLNHFLKNGHYNNAYFLLKSQVEFGLLAATLEYTDGNKARAVKIMGISRTTLLKILKENKKYVGRVK